MKKHNGNYVKKKGKVQSEMRENVQNFKVYITKIRQKRFRNQKASVWKGNLRVGKLRIATKKKVVEGTKMIYIKLVTITKTKVKQSKSK